MRIHAKRKKVRRRDSGEVDIVDEMVISESRGQGETRGEEDRGGEAGGGGYWEQSHLMMAWDDAFTHVSMENAEVVSKIVHVATRGHERVGRGAVLVTVTAELAPRRTAGGGFGASRGRLPATNASSSATRSSSSLIRVTGADVRYVPRCFIANSEYDAISILYPNESTDADADADSNDDGGMVVTIPTDEDTHQRQRVEEIATGAPDTDDDEGWLCTTSTLIDAALGINDRARLVNATAPVDADTKPWRRASARNAANGPSDDPYRPDEDELVMCVVLRVVAVDGKGTEELRYKSVGGDVVVATTHGGKTVLMEKALAVMDTESRNKLLAERMEDPDLESKMV